jgi:hypothetical protein
MKSEMIVYISNGLEQAGSLHQEKMVIWQEKPEPYPVTLPIEKYQQYSAPYGKELMYWKLLKEAEQILNKGECKKFKITLEPIE